MGAVMPRGGKILKNLNMSGLVREGSRKYSVTA
jgi:hypothetical protein